MIKETQKKTDELLKELTDQLDQHENLEDKIDQLRRFKKQHTTPIQEGFLQKKQNLEQTMLLLTSIAESILIASLTMARETVREQWGLPRYRDNTGQFANGEIALIGMGKLGGCELHFGSDLDLIFVFNRNGESFGGKKITNQEYFSKVVQRLISYLSLHTQTGKAYSVDTELRPSGQAGALVTSLDTWITYYHEHAQTWERQALLKARLLYASGDFAHEWKTKLKGLFERLIFLNPFGPELNEEIHHLRLRMEKELAKENERRWHFKKGYGALTDIEFAVQYLQLHLGKIHPKILTQNTMQALLKLQELGVLAKADQAPLEEAYLFYRKLEILLELRFDLREGWINPQAKWIDQLSEELGFQEAKKFLDYFRELREKVRKIYLQTLKIDSE